jgi:hypothetical protein
MNDTNDTFKYTNWLRQLGKRQYRMKIAQSAVTAPGI